MKHQPWGERVENKVPGASGQLGLTETLDALRVQLNQLSMQVHGIEAQTAVTPQQVRSILKARICRQECLKAGLFAEPAWDMLLELFARELEHQRIAVCQLCGASGVPEATAHRWIDNLEQEGLIIRSNDQFDRRRVWVKLSPKGSAAMQRYFEILPVRLLPR